MSETRPPMSLEERLAQPAEPLTPDEQRWATMSDEELAAENKRFAQGFQGALEELGPEAASNYARTGKADHFVSAAKAAGERTVHQHYADVAEREAKEARQAAALERIKQADTAVSDALDNLGRTADQDFDWFKPTKPVETVTPEPTLPEPVAAVPKPRAPQETMPAGASEQDETVRLGIVSAFAGSVAARAEGAKPVPTRPEPVKDEPKADTATEPKTDETPTEAAASPVATSEAAQAAAPVKPEKPALRRTADGQGYEFLPPQPKKEPGKFRRMIREYRKRRNNRPLKLSRIDALDIVRTPEEQAAWDERRREFDTARSAETPSTSETPQAEKKHRRFGFLRRRPAKAIPDMPASAPGPDLDVVDSLDLLDPAHDALTLIFPDTEELPKVVVPSRTRPGDDAGAGRRAA